MGRVRQVAQPAPTFLVTNMMRSVINEGTGAGARAAGFTLDAAGKSGTTNDLRDAWFVGFTPELLTVVWVGLDDNTPVGLSGSQAALPIWTAFMKRALAGHRNKAFAVPDGVTFVEIDKETGGRAGPFCEKVFNEAFLVGTEPQTLCYTHLGVPGGSLTHLPQLGAGAGRPACPGARPCPRRARLYTGVSFFPFEVPLEVRRSRPPRPDAGHRLQPHRDQGRRQPDAGRRCRRPPHRVPRPLRRRRGARRLPAHRRRPPRR